MALCDVRLEEIRQKYVTTRSSTSSYRWLDAPTRAFINQAFEPSQSITFTVCESRPLKLTCAEVGGE